MGQELLNTPQPARTNLLSSFRDGIQKKILPLLAAVGIFSTANNSFAQQNLPPTFNIDLEVKGYIGQTPNTAILDILFVDQNHQDHSETNSRYRYDYTAGIEPFNITPQPLNVTYTMVNPDGQYADLYRIEITGQPGQIYQFGHIAQSSGGPGNSVTGSVSFDVNGNPVFGRHATPPPLDQDDFINIPRLVSTTTTDAPCPLGYGNFTIDLAALALSDTASQEPLDPDNMMTVTLIDNTGTPYIETFPQGTTSVTMQVPAGTYTGLFVNGYDFSTSPYFNNQVVGYVPDIDTIAGTFSTVTNNPDNTTANFQSPEIVDTNSVDSVEVIYRGEHLYRRKGDPMPKSMVTSGGTISMGWNNGIFVVSELSRPNLGALDEDVDMIVYGCNTMTFSGTVEARTIVNGVDQVPEEMEELSVYPNPANDFITIKGLENQTFHYEVVDIHGKVIDYNTNQNGAINVQSRPAGMHFIQVTPIDGDTRSRELKVVKMN